MFITVYNMVLCTLVLLKTRCLYEHTLTYMYIPHAQATPCNPHGVQEVFAVWLTVEPVVPLTLPAEVDTATQTALLEPSGVVQLANSAFSGVESTGNVSST